MMIWMIIGPRKRMSRKVKRRRSLLPRKRWQLLLLQRNHKSFEGIVLFSFLGALEDKDQRDLMNMQYIVTKRIDLKNIIEMRCV